MILIVCIDDRGGMMFGGRRQSRDRLCRERILQEAGTARILMSPYSAKQFEEPGNILATEDYLSIAGPGDFVFVEDGPLPETDVEKVFLFHWNRHYPADRYFPLDPEALGLSLVSREDFPGSSHDAITLEIFS